MGSYVAGFHGKDMGGTRCMWELSILAVVTPLRRINLACPRVVHNKRYTYNIKPSVLALRCTLGAKDGNRTAV